MPPKSISLPQGFADRGFVAERPVIGYFGAIAEWFNIEWIERCAAARTPTGISG